MISVLQKHMEELRAKSSSESSAVTQNQQFQSHTDEESEASEVQTNTFVPASLISVKYVCGLIQTF